MTTAIHLVITGMPPPPTNTQERMHHMARHQLRQSWKDFAWAAWHQAGRPVWRGPRPTVTFLLVYRTRRWPDQDGAMGAIKPILDGLKGRAWLFDDTSLDIDLRPVRFGVDRQHPRVEVWIGDSPP